MNESITDRDLEVLSRLNIAISTIIEQIETVKSGEISTNSEYVKINCQNDILAISIYGSSKNVEKSIAVSALKELAKTQSIRDIEATKAKSKYKKYLNISKRNLPRDYAWIMRDSCKYKPDNETKSNHSSIANLSTPPSNEIQENANVSASPKSWKRNPFVHFAAFIAIDFILPLPIVILFGGIITFAQVFWLVILTSMYFRNCNNLSEWRHSFYSDRNSESQSQATILEALKVYSAIVLIAGYSLHWIISKNSLIDIEKDGLTTMATVSKIRVFREINSKRAPNMMDLSYEDQFGKNYIVSRDQYQGCHEGSLIRIYYRREYPSIYKITPPCIESH
jgi:hypothetical protein